MTPEVLINPKMQWACVASDVAKLKFIEGMGHDWPTLPYENQVLLLPFIVSPDSLQPVPVVVVEMQKRWGTTGHVMVVVVAVADQQH